MLAPQAVIRAHRPDATGPVHVFESTSYPGWYTIALGPALPDQRGYKALQRLLDRQVIPADSLMVSGRQFGAKVWSCVPEFGRTQCGQWE